MLLVERDRDPRRQRQSTSPRPRPTAWRRRPSTASGSPMPASRPWPAGCARWRRLPDPVGEMLDGTRRPNGLEIQRVRVPLGVVAVIYENRPNVTSDAAGHLREGGQRGAAARLGLRAPTATAPWPTALRDGMVKARAPRRRRDPRRRREPRSRGRGDAAHRVRRLPDPPRWARAHPEHPRQRDRARDHRRRRQLPRLRRRRTPISTTRCASR